MRSAPTRNGNVLASVSCFDGDLVARARGSLPDPIQAQRVAAIFDALSDTTRLKIALTLHHGGEACVSDICHVIDMSISAASQHLRRLRDAAVISKRRDGKMTYYSLRDPFVGTVLDRLLAAEVR